MAKIGLVEDDQLLQEALRILLEKEGFEVFQADTCEAGIQLLEQQPDILLLDINLPDGLGFKVCQEAKHVPVIFLTARDDEVDMLKAYDSGCEDYVVKPFSTEVLLRKIQVVLKRTNVTPDIFRFDTLVIDYQKKQVIQANQLVQLTAKEFQLLEYLTRNAGQVLSKELILQKVWDVDGAFVVENTVSVTINRLKKKIEPVEGQTKYIKNIFGMGYIFGE
ncbi:DNA-binding response regulator [Enterococcus sp. JM4C]|uniref:response regulator transcription factor n=1 Tax=Candidatus Enterococcus huntleyi TaxID=1857217 RepID=UPI00137A10B1|nr:response regulator transcription factor [Enterococcus sp. JM4C]KAF1296182.1 DNA-binding response regulator [Enterococcus sp. JM4C]